MQNKKPIFALPTEKRNKKQTQNMYADVILPIPFDTFTYSIPQDMELAVKRGSRVVVPFGKKKMYAGVVLQVHDNAPEGVTVKDIHDVLDATPTVSDRQMAFWKWMADYYLCTMGDVYNAAMPAGMKATEKKEASRRRKKAVAMQAEGVKNTLNEAQQQAFDLINENFRDKDITLFHGVTSSGKTEVYIHLIDKYISEGKQVLYLLPEIALTTQITERLRSVFGDKLGVYHSKFADGARVEVYSRLLSDNPYSLILGVRSSIFLPFRNLGLVIVDEEHETSYKQQDPAPRYHARSAAIMLARQYGAKTLLGTATPSLETFHHARSGRYGYVPLMQRYNDMQLPDIELVDIKRLRQQKRMRGAFSPALVDAIGEALSRHEQVILFQNRRGYSPFIECRTCGWVPRCEHCDVSLTYHKGTGMLSCHYCGHTYALPPRCPNCEDADFSTVGIGTERVEDQIKELFPEATTLRLDLDTARTRSAYERIISDFAAHKSDILIGTQMVSKGLDFDNVSIVGVLDADTMLNQPDFRSYERTFHILAQVAGRAGRKNHKGRVVLQTRSVDSDIISQVVTNDYFSMYQTQMEERSLFRYPPFFRLIYVYLRHKDNGTLETLSQAMAVRLRELFGDRILGPDSPPVGRVQSLFIRKIVIKIENGASVAKVRTVLAEVRQQMLHHPMANGLNIHYDVDPV